ncbi:4Fe-4S ferredoxin [bacterium (candidate division B38) B3_B38]|nr:MAG: 4Fe-4S ferredoxin [bacterium (candidate division B38) B3_B38]
MLDAGRHPNIKILAYSEVQGLEGKAGDFTVQYLKKARYIKEEVCTACGACAEKCPIKADNDFEMGLKKRKAIYIYFPQGIPAVYTIDPEHCPMILKGKCGLCAKLCQAGAIDYEQKDEKKTLHVGAVIVATGVTQFDPSVVTEYGYGRIKNVITGLEYERLISASGPTKGHLYRPSDEKLAKRVAYIQCVGSRSLKYKDYCSSVCCMYAIKDAMLAREHDEEAESYIFYSDFRVMGKRYQQYRLRGAEDYGIKYIRGRVAEIIEDAEGNPVLWYEDTRTRQVKSLTVDMVVLCSAAVPSKGVEQLAEVLGIELTPNRFVKTDPFHPTDTTVPGIFVCGFCQNPKDIAESVSQASGAASRAAGLLGITSSGKRTVA